ncbi:MAG: hypothetical protein ACE5I3_07870 [Phycisphaerae bacterium]
MNRKKQGSIVGASLWMLFIAILLCWAPFIGPLIAGVVGGKKAGDVGRAIIAVFLPGLLLALAAFLLAGVFAGLPLLGFIAGLGTFAFVASNVGPMLLGAIIGAILD